LLAIRHQILASTMKNSGGGRLIILTLKKHREGIWIRKLVERLESIKVQVAATEQNCNNNNNQIEVRTLEDWLASGWLVSDTRDQQDNHNDILGIVNRVSDAASPALCKACCAVLHYFQSLRIPVWNGSKAYSLCGNKWMHHLLFRRANLSAPTTMSYWIGDGDGDNDREEEMTEGKSINIDTSIFRQDDITGTTKLLIKPNAGGFGAGIKNISIPLPSSSSSSSGDDVIYTKQGMAKISIPSSYEDCMALIQQYEQPRDRKLYRVWFLDGKIQCAVERQIGKETEYDDDTSSAEFTSGCASGDVCTLSDASSRRNKIIKQNNGSSSNSSDQNHGNKYETTTGLSQKLSNNHTVTASLPPSESLHLSPSPSPSPRMIAWKVPNEVRQEIEDRLLPLLEDAHSGSIEFLNASTTLSNEKTSKGSSGSKEVSSSWPRLYFDLNLLSTLPVFDDDKVTEEDGGGKFWSNDYDLSCDPWHELAHSIWEFVSPHQSPLHEDREKP
jgi:hypothetical protein